MKKIVALGVVVLILIAGTVWAYRRHRVDPQLKAVLQLQAKAFDGNLPEDQRQAMRTQVRTEMGKLSEAQRRQAFDQMGARFARRENERLAAYFKMTAEQKAAYLDQQLAEMRKREQERQARQAAQQSQDGSNGQNGNAQNANNGGGPGGGANRFNQQAQNDRRNQRLDNSTPEQRAQRAAYVQDLRQRAQQTGAPLPRMGGRF
jgi:hypothetical protein